MNTPLSARLLLAISAMLANVLTVAAETISGTVVAIDSENRLLELLPEGADKSVTFSIGPGDAAVNYEGRPIQGTVTGTGERQSLERIWPTDPALLDSIERVNRLLRRDTVTRGRNTARGRNEPVPPFALWNQEGDLIQPSNLRRHPWVLNFIFTRCTVPHMCPAAAARMIELQKAAAEEGLDDVRFVTITFDPDYDTPGVLNYYGATRGADFSTYHYLTGDKQAIDDLMRQFGIITVEEDDTINHTMDTILVDRSGRISFRRPGSNWRVEEFIREIQQLP